MSTTSQASAEPKAAHTPGPWKHNGLKKPYFSEGRDPSEWLACAVWAKDENGVENIPICTTLFSVGRYKNEADVFTRDANTRLIAASPELLAALRELAHQVEISNAVDDHGHELKNLKALHDARALIARVEGK
jgi:hypothetical protein